MGQRVGFYLTDMQIKALKKVSKKTGLTVSEIIRRAIDVHLEQYKEVMAVVEETKERKPSKITVQVRPWTRRERR